MKSDAMEINQLLTWRYRDGLGWWSNERREQQRASEVRFVSRQTPKSLSVAQTETQNVSQSQFEAVSLLWHWGKRFKATGFYASSSHLEPHRQSAWYRRRARLPLTPRGLRTRTESAVPLINFEHDKSLLGKHFGHHDDGFCQFAFLAFLNSCHEKSSTEAVHVLDDANASNCSFSANGITPNVFTTWS